MDIEKQQNIERQRENLKIKELQAHILRQDIEKMELQVKHNEINVKEGWIFEQAKKTIKEARTDFEKKKAEFELKQLENDIKGGLYGEFDKLKLEELKGLLAIEEDIIKSLKKNIIKINRNYKIEKKEEKK